MFLIQVDHLNGEILGEVIERFYDAGAKNVQVLSSITKKNRPAYMIFVDGKQETADAIEQVIVNECGSSGWHRISTCHRHTNVSIVKKSIAIQTDKAIYDFEIQGKVIDDDLANARPEHDNCVSLREFLKEKEGMIVPLRKIVNYVTEAFHENKKIIKIQEDINEWQKINVRC